MPQTTTFDTTAIPASEARTRRAPAPPPVHVSWRRPAVTEMEVAQLGRYVLIAALAGVCALMAAWSRIELRETAVSLDLAERRYASAQAEQARLKLELATLRDPARLERLGAALPLDPNVKVVNVPAAASPGEVATR